MPKTYKISILSPRGKALDGEAESLVVPAVGGELGVLADHAPLVATLRSGVTQVVQGGKTTYWFTGSGIIEVSLKGVQLLVDSAEKAESADKARQLTADHLKTTGEESWG